MGERKPLGWSPFVYGGIASIVAELGTFPLDTTKTRLQIQGQKLDKKHANLRYSGMTDALLQISRQEGVKSLYCGISSAILRQATYGTIKFGSYYSLKQLATEKWGTDDIVLINIVCAAIAGSISSAIANPTDVVKVRMQVGGNQAKHSLYQCFCEVYRHEGVRGLWRGVGPTAQRAAIIAAVELPIYDFTKQRLIPFIDDSISNHFISSTTASMASAVASTPIDVIRTRLMNQKRIYMSNGVLCPHIYKGSIDCFIKMNEQALMTTLGELLGEAGRSEEEDRVLDNLKELAENTLPEGWHESKVINLSKASLFGDEDNINSQVLNKIRFALPTVGIAKAFDPEASHLSEKSFTSYKIYMLNWPFCRALITSPPAVINKLRGSAAQAELFLHFVKPVRHLFISRTEADQELKQLAKDAGPQEELSETEDESQPKKARIEALENKVATMFEILCDKIEGIQNTRNHSRDTAGDSFSDKENASSGESSPCYSDRYGTPWSSLDLEQNSPTEAIDLDLLLTPMVKECDPQIPEPDSEIKKQGIACQKLGSTAWNKIRYKEVQKKLQASPVFDALKVNSELVTIAPKSFGQTFLARTDSMTGSITHGLLLQRQKLSSAVNALVSKHPQIRQDVKELFFGESSMKTISDDLLHFTCARRAEIIELRRNSFKTGDSHHAAKLAEIPPSESHLFDEKLLAEFLYQQGGTRKVFQPEKKPFQDKDFNQFRSKPHSNTRNISQATSSNSKGSFRSATRSQTRSSAHFSTRRQDPKHSSSQTKGSKTGRREHQSKKW